MFTESFITKTQRDKKRCVSSLSAGFKTGVKQECKMDFLRNKEGYTKDGEDEYEKNKC